jgi:endonuclease/exonuclease/phosphatase family metal-dependent hydrolase
VAERDHGPARGVRRGTNVAAFAIAAFVAMSCAPPALHRAMDMHPLVACGRADCLRVVTWNLHAIPLISPHPTARLQNVATEIRSQQPDVVLFQEVWAHAYARQLARDLGGAYRVTTAVGCGRPFPCGGLAILVRVASGWSASAPRFVAYESSAPWYRFREWDGIAKKGMLIVRLSRGGATLGIVDTHLQTEYAHHGHDYTDLRRRQLEQLDATVTATFGSAPVLVGGDFNTAPDERSGLYATHLSRLGDDRTADIRTACGECGTRPSLVHSRWLDYLITRNLTASTTLDRLVNDHVDQPFSDHDGLIARFVYSPAALR